MKSCKKLLAIIMILTLLFSITGCSVIDYKTASKMMSEGKYTEAEEILSTMTDYKDSSDLLKECQFKHAEQLVDDDRYVEARKILDKLGDYDGKAELIKECDYFDANSAMMSKNYEQAIELFSKLGNYKNAEAYINECNYQIALSLYNDNKLEQAGEAFSKLNGYKDSADYITDCNYQNANALYQAGNYEQAEPLFKALNGYKDSADKCDSCDYMLANNLLEQGKYEEAAEAFEALDGYLDSDNMINECKYQEAVDLYSSEDYEKAQDLFEELGDYSYSNSYLEDINAILNPQDLVALWKCNYDVKELLINEIGGSLPEEIKVEDYFDFKKLKLTVTIKLADDSTFKFKVDAESFIKEFQDQLKTSLPGLLGEAIEIEAKQYGMGLKDILAAYGVSTVEAIFPLMYGSTFEGFIQDLVDAMKDEIAAEQLDYEGTYSISNNVITLKLDNGSTDVVYYNEENDTIQYDGSSYGLGILDFKRS